MALPRIANAVPPPFLGLPELSATASVNDGGAPLAPPNRSLPKKAAVPQKSLCFHFANGWLWHSAQPTFTPRKRRVAAAAALLACGWPFSPLAIRKAVAGLSLASPSAVSRSVTIASQPRLSSNRSASHGVNAS